MKPSDSSLLDANAQPVGGVASPQQGINVIPKSDVKTACLQFGGELSRMRADVMRFLGTLSSMRENVAFQTSALRSVSLMGGAIDRDVLSGRDEIELLSAAIEAYAQIADLLGEKTKLAVFDARQLLG